MTAFRFASSDPLDREAMESVRLRSIPRPSLLAEPLDVRHKKTAAALEVLGIDTPLDLLEHLPFRHEDRRDARPIVSLVPGEQATVIGEVRKATKQSGRWGRSRAEATIADDSGVVKAIWFNQPWVADQLEPGARLVLHGRRKDRNQFWVT
ncbi:MAG: ATP-dependent helicase RecG, partial [Thermoleophilaceae bacterium]|nr:ATP-dependent helicase RecG [Thermoleophilaceae bacterium]